jgi:hypothetical protein
MDVVPSALAAMNAHRMIVDVAMRGLGFLRTLASAPENQVKTWLWSYGWVVGLRATGRCRMNENPSPSKR